MDHAVKTETRIKLTEERRAEMIAELERHVRNLQLYRSDRDGWLKNLEWERGRKAQRGEPQSPEFKYDRFVNWISDSRVIPFRQGMRIQEIMNIYNVPYDRAWMMRCLNDRYEELVIEWIEVK